jgi:hypothetical protein
MLIKKRAIPGKDWYVLQDVRLLISEQYGRLLSLEQAHTALRSLLGFSRKSPFQNAFANGLT